MIITKRQNGLTTRINVMCVLKNVTLEASAVLRKKGHLRLLYGGGKFDRR